MLVYKSFLSPMGFVKHDFRRTIPAFLKYFYIIIALRIDIYL